MIKKKYISQWTHMNQSEKFLSGVFPTPSAHVEKVDNTYVGVITKTLKFWKFTFPIHLYYYTSLSTITIMPERGLYFVFWNKIRSDSNESMIVRQKGYCQMRGIFAQTRAPIAYLDVSNIDYHREWNSTLKNYRNKWLRNIKSGEIVIIQVSLDEFVEQYKKSDIKHSLKSFYIRQMYDFERSYHKDMNFYLVKNNKGEVIAGTCILDDYETRQSIYQYAFSHKKPEYKYIGVGIIDFCIQHTLNKGFNFLNLTAVWDKYQPKSWRGLTTFKMQFHPIISDCRLAYFKIVLKRKTNK